MSDLATLLQLAAATIPLWRNPAIVLLFGVALGALYLAASLYWPDE